MLFLTFILVISIGGLPFSDEHILVLLCFIFLLSIVYVIYDAVYSMAESDNIVYAEAMEMVEVVAIKANALLDVEMADHDAFNNSFLQCLAELNSTIPSLLLDNQMVSCELEIIEQITATLDNAVKNKTLLTNIALENVLNDIVYCDIDNNDELVKQLTDQNLLAELVSTDSIMDDNSLLTLNDSFLINTNIQVLGVVDVELLELLKSQNNDVQNDSLDSSDLYIDNELDISDDWFLFLAEEEIE